MTDNIKALNSTFKDRYTDRFVTDLAARGNPLLSGIDRMEDWGGMHLVAGGVVLTRAHDYEFVTFGEDSERMIAKCDAAIATMGRRIEANLGGARTARDWSGQTVSGGLDPISRWEGRPVMLYSIGGVPMVIPSDGMLVRRVYQPDGNAADGSPAWKQMPGRYEVRFAYYGNTGPK